MAITEGCVLSRFRIRAAFAALLVLPGLVACGGDAPAAQGRGGEERAVPVTTTVVQPSPWSDSLQALGTVKARESVTLTSKVSEVVQDVHFDSGDEVRAGAPIVTLRGEAQQAALAEAQASYDESERLFKRQSELADQQLIARATLDTQRAARDSARARVRQMRSDIGDRSVRAPFGGVLGTRQVSPGALILPSTVIATLDDISRVFVDFQVPEAALASVKPGNEVTGTSTAYPARTFEGEVSTIDARLDVATRAVNVRADFPNPDKLLRPGMLMQVELYRPERQALVIPEIAVVQVGRDSFVYRVKGDDTVEQAGVETGARRSGKVEIVAGLAAGDRIVVDGTGKLREGAKVAESVKEAVTEDSPAPRAVAAPQE